MQHGFRQRDRWRVLIHLTLLGLLTASTTPISVTSAPKTTSRPPLPTVWQVIWSNQVSTVEAQNLKAIDIDNLFKCVAYRPNYPDPPIYAGGEWRLVETVQGQYNWTDLKRCLDDSLQVNMWVIPEIVLNIPPDWMRSQYPDAVLRDSQGAIKPSNVDAPYLLSPWFVATGAIDAELQAFLDSFLALVSTYPNVAGIMIGNFVLNQLPWRLGDGEDFTYWPIWDRYARADYQARFGTSPPKTWADYQALSVSAQADFRDWLTSAMRTNLQTRYLPWIQAYTAFHGWTVIDASIWDDNGVQGSIFTTTTPEMTTAKQAAIKASGLDGIVIDDDNMGDCGLASMQQQDIDLAHSNGFLIVGERVPDTCDWFGLYTMWIGFSPLPDAFANIEMADPYWIGEFRLLYGPATEPLGVHLYLPTVTR